MKGVKIDVEIYEAIRKLHVQDNLSQRAIAKKLGISRNTVRKYIDGAAVPWERKPYTSSGSKVITEDVESFINHCLRDDESHTHNKQKHTAKRIYDRLVDELDFTGSYTTVRRVVRELKKKSPEPFIPLEFDPGEAMQIDFGSAYIHIDGHQIKTKYFCARLCYSASIFTKAYYAENEECFLDGLASAFAYFGGVPHNVIFDNARVAVKEGYGAYVTKLTDGYSAFKSHYAFNAHFCNPSSGNEKGLVENLVGFIRRNTMVPLPKVASLEELNDRLIMTCKNYQSHRIQGQIQTVGEKLSVEHKALLPLPKYKYELAKTFYIVVNKFSTVAYETNKYSVPTEFIGKEVLMKIHHSTIEVCYKKDVIAVHKRAYTKHNKIYDISHYMTALERKPRAIFNAQPVREFVPKEILESFSAVPGGNKEVLNYIKTQINLDNQDVVSVKQANLSSYDRLIQEVK